MDRNERAQALAKTAFGLMAERSVAPTPENFHLFYTYASGDNAAVSRIMGDMIAARRKFTSEVLEDLRRRFSDTARLEDAVDNAGTGIAETLNSVLDRLEEANRQTEAYGRTLTEASGELGDNQSPARLRKLVDGLISATKAMEARTQKLEGELQRSSREANELKSKLADVRKESLTDPLTGVANRKAFDLELTHAIEHARKSGDPLSLLMCDIDRFKTFNDNWGHQTGDQVLRLVANCLSENLKGRDTAARYGGEEFAVIVRNTPLDAALSLANQIRTSVEGKKLVKKSTGEILGTITISIGVSQLNASDDSDALIGRADTCLYTAKNLGRNCVIGESRQREKAAVA